jgi:bifunctional non-homologous end joining protein LigD
VIGRYDGDRLVYVGRTRNGFTPALRERIAKLFAGLEVYACPFVNLPEAKSGRWGAGLTAEKMKDCRWLKPVLLADFEFVEETPEGHLRHPRFVRLHAKRDSDR